MSSHLGCMRAQIHTASGETEEALQVLKMVELLLSINKSTAEDAKGATGDGHVASEDFSKDKATEMTVQCTKDSFSPNPSGLIECLCLSDLLVEISQAEAQSSRLRFHRKH